MKFHSIVRGHQFEWIILRVFVYTLHFTFHYHFCPHYISFHYRVFPYHLPWIFCSSHSNEFCVCWNIHITKVLIWISIIYLDTFWLVTLLIFHIALAGLVFCATDHTGVYCCIIVEQYCLPQDQFQLVLIISILFRIWSCALSGTVRINCIRNHFFNDGCTLTPVDFRVIMSSSKYCWFFCLLKVDFDQIWFHHEFLCLFNTIKLEIKFDLTIYMEEMGLINSENSLWGYENTILWIFIGQSPYWVFKVDKEVLWTIGENNYLLMSFMIFCWKSPRSPWEGQAVILGDFPLFTVFFKVWYQKLIFMVFEPYLWYQLGRCLYIFRCKLKSENLYITYFRPGGLK